MARRLLVALLALVPGLGLAVTGSTPIQLSPDGKTVWVVNPDSNTVARIDAATATRTGEFTVGRYPRTVAVTSTAVYVANQFDDSVTRLDVDDATVRTLALPFGCAPYGIAQAPAGTELYVSCQGTSALVVLGPDLAVRRTVPLGWPEARAVAVGPDGRVYVTHYITKEPNHAGHVSEIDPGTRTVTRVFAIEPDFATCETTAGGQGIANLLNTAVVVPDPSPALWVGGTLHNSLRKGLFQRSRYFQDLPGVGLFPDLDFQSNPAGEGERARRNIYKPALHDIARAGIWVIDLGTGTTTRRLDVTGGGTVGALVASGGGDIAYAADLMANGFYVFPTARGANGNPTTLFGPVSAFGPGGAQPGAPCTGDGRAVVAEDAHILSPQARLVPTGGMEPLDAASLLPVDTGLEWTLATGGMRGVPDGVGTTPIGIALSADERTAFVANYLARNVAVVAAAPVGFRCQSAPATPCRTRLECPGGGECMPLVEAVVPSTDRDPLPPDILDGKILFSTSARDAAGAGSPVPPFNRLARDGTTRQGEVTSTARGGASLACTSCHGDFAGNDGRTWDFSQFGSSLRNTMDLRGRASFVPGRCSHDAGVACTTDAECRAGGPSARCLGNPAFTPPNIAAAERATFLNPMGSTHWNGDRDEVEDFEFTFRELLGASDCDGNEHTPETCVGALIVRRFVADQADVRVDLFPIPNRHRSPRLDHLADYVYGLTGFPRNPNLGGGGAAPSEAAARGRLLFNDPVVGCSFCHNSAPPARQQFTDKRPNPGYDPTQTPRADLNSPFLLHDVGTTNVFDRTNPFSIANDEAGLLGFTLFQNAQNAIPGNRNVLNAYLTSVLNDVWNTAPYLHDGTAPTLLEVVRPCLTRFGRCDEAGRGRNVDDKHGKTSFLSARQLNDLAAFQEAPHGLVVEEPAANAVFLDVERVKIHFGRRPASDTLRLEARAALPQSASFDPAVEPVTISVGVPAGERLTIVERTLPPGALRVNRARTRFRFVDRGGRRIDGLRKLVVTLHGRRLAVRAAVAGVDLSGLRVPLPDYTVAVEIGDDTLAATRRFRTARRGTVVKGP